MSCYSCGLGEAESLGVYGVFGDSGGHGGTTSEAAVPAPALAALTVLKSGDMEQCPHKSPSPCHTHVIYPCHYTNACPHLSQKHAQTHTHTRTRAHTHTHTQASKIWSLHNLHKALYAERSSDSNKRSPGGWRKRVSGAACVKTPHR